jgi:multidrug efflux pump subunit AcrA (membrane-fusion protein)
MSKLRNLILSHKIISVVAVVLILLGGYYWHNASSGTATVSKYVIQKAAQGTVIVSVQGSGQVQAMTTIDVKPQATETVTHVYVQPGDHVAAGQLLVQLDTTNEAKALKQAQLSLQSAEISLAKLQETPATTTLGQTKDAVTQAEQQLVTASTTLEKDYQSGFDAVGSSFIDLQNIVTGLQNFIQGTDVNKNQSNPDAYVNIMPSYLSAGALPYRNSVYAAYLVTVPAYQQNLADFHAANRNSDQRTLDALFAETYATAKSVSDGVKSAKDLLNYIVNNYPNSSSTNPLPAVTNTFQTNFGSYTNTINSDVGNLLDARNTITSDKNAISNAELSLKEKQDTLAALLAGPDSLDVQSQNLSIEQQQLSLQTAEQNLADTGIRAPIAGVISAVPAVVGATVPSPAVSIVGASKVALVTLNEVDAAKVSLGQKATLTFDAISGLSLAGQVVEVDPVGTVSQGVVNYNVKVSFGVAGSSTSSEQVKPGMSVTANIVTQVNQNVVAVPNSAVLTQSGTKYVLEPASPVPDAELASSAAPSTGSGQAGGILLAASPVRVPVTVGIANSTLTEITSGLNVGDQYVVRTVKGAAASTASTGSGSSIGSLGRVLGGGVGGPGR